MIDLTIAKQDESYAGDGVRFVIDPVELYPMMFDHLAKMKKSDAPTASPLRDYH